MRLVSELFNPRKRCFSGEAILLLDKLIIPDPNIPVGLTNQTITFNQLPLRTTKKEILKSMGSPKCKHKETVGPIPTCVLGYYERINKVPVRIHFFLHKDVSWFAEYRFNAISHKDAGMIRETLRQKYCPETNLPSGNFAIEDPRKQRLLFYDNGICLHVKFIDTTSPEAQDERLRVLFTPKQNVMV